MLMRPITDLIIRMQPYHSRIKEICHLNPDFAKSLKATNPKKFISLGAIITSYPSTGDEVIGIFSYDYKRNEKIFKQDFIVNLGNKGK